MNSCYNCLYGGFASYEYPCKTCSGMVGKRGNNNWGPRYCLVVRNEKDQDCKKWEK